jgi:lipopolysaccharide export system ATP-binding protein
MTKLVAEGVIVEIQDNRILSDVYFHMEDRGVIGLFGRNGSGKSTLMRVLFNELKPQWSRITIDGAVLKSPYLIQGLMKYLPQNSSFPASIRCSEAMVLFKISSKAEEIIQVIVGFLNGAKVSELSLGQRRSFEMLVLLFTDSKFVLLDEPFTGLSPILIEKIIPLIKEQSENKGILITDHQWSSVLEISDRYYLMHRGNLKEYRNKDQIRESSYLNSFKEVFD